jgi:hypothetical protein
MSPSNRFTPQKTSLYHIHSRTGGPPRISVGRAVKNHSNRGARSKELLL